MANKFPTEVLELPSKGWFYPQTSPLASGKIEIRYMTAKEEDILTSTNLVKKGVAIDMVLKSIIVTPIDYDSLLVGDKNAIMVATRILGYGKDYQVQLVCPACESKKRHTIDLSKLEHKEINVQQHPKHVNEFEFELPVSKKRISFKFLTGVEEKAIEEELKGLKQAGINANVEMSTRLKYIIVSVDGKRDRKSVSDFVDNEFLAADSLPLRKKISELQPDVDLQFNFTCANEDCGYEERMRIPLTVEFFWPSGRG